MSSIMRARSGLMGRDEVSDVIGFLSRAEGCWTFNARDRMPQPSRATAHHVVENAPTETRAPLPRERVRSTTHSCPSPVDRPLFALRLQLAFKLVEKAPVGTLRDDFVGIVQEAPAGLRAVILLRPMNPAHYSALLGGTTAIAAVTLRAGSVSLA